MQRLVAVTLSVLGLVLIATLPQAQQASAHHVAAISARGMHTCLLTAASGVQCWGRGNSGQLGNGSTTDSALPVNVTGLGSGVVAIDMGIVHSCAVTEGGGVKCWGNNSGGQLGGESTETCVELCSTTPVDVVGLDSVAAVAAGFRHTCALTTSGNVKCWGINSHGELGDGTTTTSITPVDVLEEPGGAPLSDVAAITTGDYHTCALTTTGGAKCWGGNLVGQVGNGTIGHVDPANAMFTTPVDVMGLSSGVASISAGEFQTCALATAGGLKCWGDNSTGQLGDGQTCGNACSTPVEVVGLDSGVATVSGGGMHTCALMTSGGVKCWGQNFFGELGDGTAGPGTNRLIPVDVVVLHSSAVAVSAGAIHTCALTSSGSVSCWGNDNFGQTGDSDGDGCTDFAEHGSDPVAGGLRDHESYWDFFDTPNAQNTRDRRVTVGDIGGVVARFGATGEAGGDPLADAPPAPAYHSAFDRGGQAGPHPWDLAPADGGIAANDISAVVAQFGHSCA